VPHPCAGYRVIDYAEAASAALDGWREPEVAQQQDAAFRALMGQMDRGQPRSDLLAAAAAVRFTGLASPSLLEVGCGSGYASAIFEHLLPAKIQYVGLDYSAAMIELARRRFPRHAFLVGDATALPFPSAAFAIVLNGVSLMHVLNYRAAIRESRRVARQWCLFHTVPVLQRRETTFLRKSAYGRPTVEVVFNEAELRHQLESSGLSIRKVSHSLPYNLKRVLGEPTTTKTFACEVIAEAKATA
jgi:ubiquinone/menaquinone biosynthesis C-methylase UbiE